MLSAPPAVTAPDNRSSPGVEIDKLAPLPVRLGWPLTMRTPENTLELVSRCM